MRVFEGGEGWTSGGKSDRSSDKGLLVPEDARERDGEGISTAIVSRSYKMLSSRVGV